MPEGEFGLSAVALTEGYSSTHPSYERQLLQTETSMASSLPDQTTMANSIDVSQQPSYQVTGDDEFSGPTPQVDWDDSSNMGNHVQKDTQDDIEFDPDAADLLFEKGALAYSGPAAICCDKLALPISNFDADPAAGYNGTNPAGVKSYRSTVEDLPSQVGDYTRGFAY